MTKKQSLNLGTALLPVKYTVQIEKLFMRLEHGIFPRSSRFLMHKLVLY